MRLYQEEIFGPVVSIIPFDDDDEAVAMANDTTYGLAATAWTNNLSRAHRLGKRSAGRHRLDQLPVGLRPRRAVRRLQAVGLGPRIRPEGVEAYLKTKSVWAQL